MRPGLFLALCLAPLPALAEGSGGPVFHPMTPFVIKRLPSENATTPEKPARADCIALDLAMRAAFAEADLFLPEGNPLGITQAERREAEPRVEDLKPVMQDYAGTLRALQNGHETSFSDKAFLIPGQIFTCIQHYAQPSTALD
ncbi:hypothetical protein [Rhodobacter lacus]|uniref:Uncharacterized protein n=1 Tax=Rhodobacter lacus TaxID=1641972 RepID=A0ABW5A988_9RHOB